MPPSTSLLCGLLALAAALPAAGGENWPNWRGPNFNGSAAADEKNLPVSWSETRNVLWKVPLPGPSGSTPVVWGDRIFLTASDRQTQKSAALCLSTADGKVLWRRDAGNEVFVPQNTMTAPSPVTDGKRAYFLFGTGNLGALDFDGKEVWSRSVLADGGMPAIKFGYSSSPLLYKDRLYVQVIQNRQGRAYRWSPGGKDRVDSYLLAIDPATGKDLWRQVRDSDAQDEAQESYATPTPRGTGKGEEILVFGGNYVTAHDAATGKELWRWGSYNPERKDIYRVVPCPVDCEGIVVACAPKDDPVFAFRPEQIVKGQPPGFAWKFDRFPSDVCTPLYYDKRLYVLDGDRRAMTCIDPAASKVLWMAPMGNNIYRASPTGADGKIYCIDVRGAVTVLKAGDKFESLAQFTIGEQPSFSTILAVGGRLYVRTGGHLYCIANPSATTQPAK